MVPEKMDTAITKPGPALLVGGGGGKLGFSNISTKHRLCHLAFMGRKAEATLLVSEKLSYCSRLREEGFIQRRTHDLLGKYYQRIMIPPFQRLKMLALKPACKVSSASLQIWKSPVLGDPFTGSRQKPELLTCDQLLQLTAAHGSTSSRREKKYPSCTGFEDETASLLLLAKQVKGPSESQGERQRAPPSDERR